MMNTDAIINSVLDILFICKIGHDIKYILKVASPHLNNIIWSKTANYIVGAFFTVVCMDFFPESSTVIMFLVC